MKRKNLFILLMLLHGAANLFAQQTFFDSLFERSVVLNTMGRVADWQIGDWSTNGFQKPKYNWTYAAAYTGIFELAKTYER